LVFGLLYLFISFYWMVQRNKSNSSIFIKTRLQQIQQENGFENLQPDSTEGRQCAKVFYVFPSH